MREEQSYERLLQALQDMKNEIAKQIRPVEEQIVQANVEHLRQTFSQESRRFRNASKRSTIISSLAANTCRTTSGFARVSAGLTKN